MTDIRQGDIFWVDLEAPGGSEPGYRRPAVVIQNNSFNESRLHTVMLCPITSNLKWAGLPGNILIKKGEGNLQRDSVVNVSQITTVDRSFLEEKIGTLTKAKVREIIEGIKSVIEPREPLP